MIPSIRRRVVAAALLSTGLVPAAVLAQQPATSGASPARGQYESRAELEAQVKAAEAAHRTSEAWLLDQRLKKGDFQESDRVVITLQNSPTPLDTLTVRAGKVLEIPRFGSVSLDGVLRSELQDKVETFLLRFLKEPNVRATPLVRIGVLGRVGRPGYYYPAADVILSDVLTMAGGPAPDADMGKITIKRGPDVIWNSADARTALTDGITIDRLHLRAGDEISIGTQKQFSWMTALGAVSGIVLLLVSLARLR